MDQLKQYWEVAKKQHFWILCGLVVLVPFIAYWISSGHLAKVYADQMSTIKRVDGDLGPLVNAPDHPNQEWVTHVKAETEKLRTNVLGAWDSLYNKQKAELKWPPELRADFIAAFSKPAAADDPRVLEPLCERYQNFVKTELSEMADIVKAEWAPGEKGGGHSAPDPRRGRPHNPRGAASEEPAEAKKTYIVYWDPADQGRLVDAYDWQDPPSPLDVRYAQEELWVLEAICKAIDRTNVGATGDFDAVVRDIDSTLIGYDATGKYPLGEGATRLERPRQSGQGNSRGPMAAPAGMGPAGAPGQAFEPKRPMRHRTTDEGALGGTHHLPFVPPGGGIAAPVGPVGPVDPDAWLKDGRYVDTKGKPLLGSDWANTTTPEYNLMAFKLTIVADEQRWQKLLVELCNSPLPLEVREVRVNPNDHQGGGGAAPAPRSRPGHEGGADSAQHNVTLEISGVAYLMNPPNLSKLGITAAGAAPGAVGVPPVAAPPVATPPAVPATGATPPAVAPVAAPTGVPTSAPPTTVPPTTAPPDSGPPSTAPPSTAPPAATSPAVSPTGSLPTATPPTTAPPTTAPPTTAPPATAPPVGK